MLLRNMFEKKTNFVNMKKHFIQFVGDQLKNVLFYYFMNRMITISRMYNKDIIYF